MIAYKYSLYRRFSKRLGKDVYYIRFRDPDTGQRLPGRSSGESDKNKARMWADDQLKSGRYSRKADMKFSKYAEDWWKWDKCEYIKRKQRLRHNFSQKTAEEYRRTLAKYIIPFFGDYKLNKITVDTMERFRDHLSDQKTKKGKPLSSSSINSYVSIVSTMLGEATRREFIPQNPASGIGRFERKDSETRDILTRSEANSLLNKNKINEIWFEYKYYVLNLLAATTGMRLGECVGLQKSQIKVNPEDNSFFIDIKHAWSDKYGLQLPKWNSIRKVPISLVLKKELDKLLMQNPSTTQNDPFIFFGRWPDRPMSRKAITENLYAALEKIGIDDTLRRERNLTFHSWRHFFNTNMRPHTEDSILRSVTGHKTETMTEDYTHYKNEHFADIRKAQESMFNA